MVTVLQGGYSGLGNTIVIPSGPGQGTYSNVNDAILSLCSSANATISTLISSYPSQTANINNNWSTLTEATSIQTVNLDAANIDYANLVANSFPAVKSFVDNLHEWGIQTEAGGPAEYLQAVAQTSNQTGQAIIGALREARNIAALSNAGVGLDSAIPAVPATPPQPGNLTNPNYTPAEASSQIVTN